MPPSLLLPKLSVFSACKEKIIKITCKAKSPKILSENQPLINKVTNQMQNRAMNTTKFGGNFF